ncbi:Gfo/Idh/MocA family protein [Tundrisphaera sp. TA3]|uniref:Gfo/Idh/MocA family protein n=1 Tax=Tundrisphaera sp. TA3 TaxID=3435775 RepID=UPI003EB709C7
MTGPTTRRRFLADSSSALAVGAVASATALGQDQPKAEKAAGANDKIVLGFIGVGGMGSGLLNIFKKMPDVEVAAVCDLDEAHVLRAKEAAGGKPDTYGDFRRVLDRKDIDAVVVATPDHWHAIPSILACQAGKDVYCEKPLSHLVHEGRAMVTAAEKNKRVTQMGNLIHATENFHRVAEIVQSGVLGKITKTRVWMNADKPGIGNPPDGPPPSGFDYDFWLGSAPKRAYNPNRSHFTWRYFWDYGGGVLGDFVCHLVDLVHWGMQVDAPETIAAMGGKYAIEDNTETPDTLEVLFHYAKGFDLVWTQTDASSHGFEGKKQGIEFQGRDATLFATYGTFQVFAEDGRKIELPSPTLPRSPGHHRQWLDAIKTRAQCDCHFEYGHRLATVGHLGNAALRTGSTLKWDREAERVTNNEEANRILAGPEARSPWTLPAV